MLGSLVFCGFLESVAESNQMLWLMYFMVFMDFMDETINVNMDYEEVFMCN